MQEDCLRLQKSEKEVDNVSNVTGMKVLFLSSSLVLLLLMCIPPCTWCKSLSELCGVFIGWHSIAFGTYKGICNQAHSIHCSPSWRERPLDVLRVSLTGISSPKHGAVSICPSIFILVLFCPCGCMPWIPFGQEGWGRGSWWHSGGVSQHSGGLSWPRTVWWQQFCTSDSSLRELGLFQKGNIKPWVALAAVQQFSLTRFLTWFSAPHSV